MKIVARIQKVAENQYRFDGRTFDSFLSARRAMSILVKQRRQVRHMRGLAVLHASGARHFVRPEIARYSGAKAIQFISPATHCTN